MSVSDFFENLIGLALVPFNDTLLGLYTAGILCVTQLFRIVHRLMHL